MKMVRKASVFCVSLIASIALEAVPVEWQFPRNGNCHEGMAFSDGVTGVLVWGGEDTLKITVGRGDLWDHRGGYPWTEEQSYTNIVSAVNSGDAKRLYSLFKKETPAGEPRNPFLVSLGRVTVKMQGVKLLCGNLDPKTGLAEITVLSNGKTNTLELAMAKKPRAFAVKFPSCLDVVVNSTPALETPVVKKALGKLKYPPVERIAPRKKIEGGFYMALPADPAVMLRWEMKDDTLLLGTSRGQNRVEFPDDCTFDSVRSSSVNHWKAFWNEGASVTVPDPVLQRVFDYGMYRFGAMTDPDGVPAGLQGPWLEDDKLVPWNGDYHFNINVQECYSPSYRGGHLNHLMPLFKMVLSWKNRLSDNARKFAGVDGYVLPHSVDDRGNCIGGFWTGTIDHGSTAWVASMMFRYVKYSGDKKFLKDHAYDFMAGAMRVYRAMMEEKDGKLSIPLGPSPEWGASDVKKAVGRDPSFQLAAAHRLARDLISASEILGVEADPMWLDVIKRLPPFTADESGIMLFKGQRFVESHRHHSHMAGFYPFDTIDMTDKKNSRIIENTYGTWVAHGTGQWTGWCVPWASILYTHNKRPRAAVHMLKAWAEFYCDEGYGSHHNAVFHGFTGWTGGRDVMQMDGMCAAVTAIMELLVHEVNGKTHYFRGCPESWKEVSFKNIRLSDGRKVSGSRVNGVSKLSVSPEPCL
jgi:hypothetical protein